MPISKSGDDEDMHKKGIDTPLVIMSAFIEHIYPMVVLI